MRCARIPLAPNSARNRLCCSRPCSRPMPAVRDTVVVKFDLNSCDQSSIP